MADDTRVTRTRSRFACAMVLCGRWALLPQVLGLPTSSFAATRLTAASAPTARRRGRRARADALAAEHRGRQRPGATQERRWPAERRPGRRVAAPNVDVRRRDRGRRPLESERRGRRRAEPGTAGRADVTVAVVDQPSTPTHPDRAARRAAPRLRRDPATATSPRRPVLTDHGTHVAGHDRGRAQQRLGIVGLAPRRHGPAAAGARQLRRRRDRRGARGVRLRRAPTVSRSSSARSRPSRWLAADAQGGRRRPARSGARRRYPDTLYVVAAGNEGNDNDDLAGLPVQHAAAATTPPNIICVGMTDSDGRAGVLGQRRAASVDLFAPGTRRSARPSRPARLPGAYQRHVDGRAARRRRGRAAHGADDRGVTPDVIKETLLDARRRLSIRRVSASGVRAERRDGARLGLAGLGAADRRAARGRPATPTTTACRLRRRLPELDPARSRAAARTPTATARATSTTTAPASPTRAGPTPTATRAATRAIRRPRRRTSTATAGGAGRPLPDVPAPTADGCPVVVAPPPPPGPSPAPPAPTATPEPRRRGRPHRLARRRGHAEACDAHRSAQGGEGDGQRLAHGEGGAEDRAQVEARALNWKRVTSRR